MTTAVAVKHELAILDETGDTKLIWDSESADEVENAKRTFKDLKKKGYIAFAVDKKGEKGTILEEFDKDAEKIILAPQMAGG